MAIKLYTDHNVPRAITIGLRMREVDVLTAFEDGTHTWGDPALLDRAHELQRILFSRDDDLLVEANLRQSNKIAFSGVVYAHQLNVSIGACVRDLELIAKIAEPDDLLSKVMFLPL